MWSENSTAVDPFTDLETRNEITRASDAIGVPILVGGMVDSSREKEVLNQGIVWQPGVGGGDRYTKRHPVPYGEYIPYRGSFIPDTYGQLALIPRDMARGTSLEPLRIAGARVADAICFDVSYDDAIHGQVANGGQLITVQTSNAMFINTAQIDQQFEISRLRAIETGRYVVVAAINGVSGIIAPDGEVRRVGRSAHPRRHRRRRHAGRRADTRRWRWVRGPDASSSASRLSRLRSFRSRIVVRDGRIRLAALSTREGRPVSTSDSSIGLGRIVMVIPTFNEADQPGAHRRPAAQAQPDVDMLVVDDNSPDGTGDIADRLAAADRQVQVLHRTAKGGLGAAYLHGFAVALEQGYDVIGEMDADGSHQPEQLAPAARRRSRDADLVIGSRYVPGGSIINWPRRRELLSRGGNLYVRLLLGMGVKDATAGFRVFRRQTLEKIDLASVTSTGYVFQTDMAYRTIIAGLKVVEVPIEFIERVRGDSKMSGQVASESLKKITAWGLRERREQLRRALRRRDSRKALRGSAHEPDAGSPHGCSWWPSWWCRWSRSSCSSRSGR